MKLRSWAKANAQEKLLVSVAGLAVCYMVILSGRVTAMQYVVLRPLPKDDEDPRSAMRLPGDATRSEWDDENVHAKGNQAVPWTNRFAPTTSNGQQPLLEASSSLPRDLGSAPGLDDPAHKDLGTAGAGFGASCGPHETCSSSLGLACLTTEHQDYRCGCAAETPVFINEGGIKKCVRAKSIYESCVTHVECTYQNPNLQCVDFLCYCPLPYVLTESHGCISPSDPHNNMVFAIAPAAMLIAVILMVGGAYTYKRMVAGGGGGGGGGGVGAWSSASSIAGLRASFDRPSDSTRRVSSAIRMGRKAEASRRMRRSLDEHGAALLRDAKAPRHPPRYIRSKPREQSVQKSFWQGVRANLVQEQSTQSTESESVVPRHSGPFPTKAATNVQRILPMHEEVAVHIIRKSSTSGRGSQELSTEVPWLRQAQEEACRRQSPTRLLLPRDDPLRRVLHQAEVKISVERHGSTSEDDKRLSLKFFGDQSCSQPSGSSTSKLRGQAKTESTTEDSFMREIRYQTKTAVTRPSVQDRAISTDLVFTMDSAVQPDKAVPAMVDRSQQMSDLPSFDTVPTTLATARKSVQMIQQKTSVPVHQLVQEIESKQRAANMVEAPPKQIEEKSAKPQLVSLKETKKEPEKIDTPPVREGQQQSGTSVGGRLSFLKRNFSDSSPSKTNQAVAKDPSPPLDGTAKDDFERPAKADFVRVAMGSHRGAEKEKRDAIVTKARMPTSPRYGATVISGASPTRSPAFSDVLQELIQQHAQRKARATPREDAPCEVVPQKTATPQPREPNLTPAESATGPSPPVTGFPPKVSMRQSPFQLTPQETTRSLSPPFSPHFYTTTVEESDMLCPAVQGIAKSNANEQVANETASNGGRTPHGITDGSSADPVNIPATVLGGSELRLGRSRLHPHTFRDDGIRGEEQATATLQVRLGRSSGNLNSSAGKKPSKVYAWGDSFSVSGETPSDESRVGGNVASNSPRNSGTGQALSLRQELEAANAAADMGLEQTFRCPRIENNWNPTSPDAVIGSMDVQSSETSLAGLRAAFKDSVGVTSLMSMPRDETALVSPALKDKKAKGSEQKKRVNFQEKPFVDVLAEIEDDCALPGEADIAEDDKKEPVKGDSLAEESAGSNKSGDEENIDRAFNESRGGATSKTGTRNAEDNDKESEDSKGEPPAPIAQDEEDRNASRQTMKQARTQGQDVGPDRSVVEWHDPKELAVRTTELWLPPSPARAQSSKNNIVSHPFCRSDEGPLVPSASTTLSFLSSDSNISTEHRVTDLRCLPALAYLAAPFQETGDGKSRTAAPNLPVTPKPESHTVQDLRHSQREPQQQHQEGEQQRQQWNEQPMSPRATSAEDRSALSSRRLRMLKKAKRQDSKEDRSSRPPKRPNTGERQRVGRFAAKERRWGDDIIRVIMMGNKHYLHERSTTSPRPLPASIAAVPPLDETQYIAQQIDRTPTTAKDAAHTSHAPSSEVRPSADVARTVPEETALSRDLSAHTNKQASAGSSDGRQEKQAYSPPSDRVSQRSSSRASSITRTAATSPDTLAARHHATWGPSGEQRKMETIAEALCEIELQDSQAVAKALEPKVSELVVGDVFGGDTLERVKSPIQIVVVEDSMDGFAPSLTSELEAESQLTPTWPQWDARERDLLASVKMLSEAVGTPESFSKTIELPSPEGLLMSETSTLPSRVDAAAPSSIGCSVALEPSASALSHTRTGSPKSVRSRRLSILEGPCFESIYNSILQPGSSPGLSLSIPALGSHDFAGLFGFPGRPSGPASVCSAVPAQAENPGDGESEAVGETATTSRHVNLAPGFTALQRSESSFREVLVPHVTETTTATHCEEREEPNRRTPHLSGEAPPSNDRGSSEHHQPSSVAQLLGEAVAGDIQNEAGSDEDERSSFFSFEESVSETCLLPDAANLEWTASSAASSSRPDLG